MTNGVIQIGALIEIDGEVAESFNEKFRPFLDDEISEKALEVNGTTEAVMWMCGIEPQEAFRDLRAMLRKHVDRFDSKDKFMLCGYGCRFDDIFMKQWFIKNGDKFWGSYAKRQVLDLLPVMIFLREMGLVKTKDLKLATVCKLFNIQHDAHDAFGDAKATYELYGELNKLLVPDWDEGSRWDRLNEGAHITQARGKLDEAFCRAGDPIDIESGPFEGGI